MCIQFSELPTPILTDFSRLTKGQTICKFEKPLFESQRKTNSCRDVSDVLWVILGLVCFSSFDTFAVSFWTVQLSTKKSTLLMPIIYASTVSVFVKVAEYAYQVIIGVEWICHVFI